MSRYYVYKLIKPSQPAAPCAEATRGGLPRRGAPISRGLKEISKQTTTANRPRPSIRAATISIAVWILTRSFGLTADGFHGAATDAADTQANTKSNQTGTDTGTHYGQTNRIGNIS